MISVFKHPVHLNGKDRNGLHFCASFSRKGTADTIAIAKQMGEGSSSFTRGEIVGITLDLPVRIRQAILAGQAVRINGLGLFKPQITVDKVREKAEDLRISAVSISGINFKPDKELIAQLNAEAEFEWVSLDKVNADDADDADKKPTPDDGDDQQPDTDPSTPSQGTDDKGEDNNEGDGGGGSEGKPSFGE